MPIRDLLTAWRRNLDPKTVIFWCIFLFLLILPFFWFDKHQYILGEDDTGLTYYNPIGMINTSLSSWFSLDHIPRFEESAGHIVVFSLALLLLRTITFNLINVQLLAYGFILSFSFFFIVKILELLHDGKKSIGFIIAGLFYALSTYFIITEYYYLLPSTFAIVLGPALAYYFLKAALTKSVKPLLIGAIWSFILSRVLITPTFIDFLFFLTLFILVYYYFNKKKVTLKRLVGYFVIYLSLIAAINAMIIIPITYSLTERGSGALKQTLTNRGDPKYLDNMVSYIKSEIQLDRLSYYLINVFPEPIVKLQGFRDYDFYLKYVHQTAPLMFIIALSTVIGLLTAIRKRPKTILPVLFIFLLIILFIMVNLFNFFEQFYYFLMYKTPVFNMNRIPSQKFHVSYLFYYSLLTGICLSVLPTILKRKYAMIVYCLIIIAILINSYFFISGRLFTEKIPPSYSVRAMDFNKDYKKLTQDFHHYIKDDAKLLLFPMGYGFGAFITGEDDSQFYRATVTGFKSFTNYDLFGNLRVFSTVLDSSMYEKAKNYYFNHNVNALFDLAKRLNIKYIVYTKNIEPLKNYGELIPELTYDSPHYYDPIDRSSVIYENANYKVFKIKPYDNISKFTLTNPKSTLSFKKIADFLYILKIKTSGNDRLAMQEGYSDKWQMFQIKKSDFDCGKETNYAKKLNNIFECEHSNNNFIGNLRLLSFLNLPTTSYSHYMINSVSNAWNIDTKNEYQYVAILYDAQKYYILGLLLSFGILISYCAVLIFYHEKK